VSSAMDWSEWRSSAGLAANITSLAMKFAEAFKGKPRPELRAELKSTGGGSGVDFSAKVSEIGNQIPAIGVHVYAELEGEGVVYEKELFNLAAGELDKLIMFSLERPKHGTLVKACNDATTLYGRALTVTAVSENGGVASATWREIEYDPETERGRWQAMQAARGESSLGEQPG
jgi:hypothetical protein